MLPVMGTGEITKGTDFCADFHSFHSINFSRKINVNELAFLMDRPSIDATKKTGTKKM